MIKYQKLLFVIAIIIVQSIGAQNVTNSLKFAEPRFTQEELDKLSINNGCYLETIEYIGGSFYKGSGFIRPQIEYNYFIGFRNVNWKEYYSYIGLENEKNTIVKHQRFNTVKTTSIIVNGTLAMFGILAGGINYSSDPNNSLPKYMLIGGSIALIPTIISSVIKNPHDNIEIPLSTVAKLSNDKNRSILNTLK